MKKCNSCGFKGSEDLFVSNTRCKSCAPAAQVGIDQYVLDEAIGENLYHATTFKRIISAYELGVGHSAPRNSVMSAIRSRMDLQGIEFSEYRSGGQLKIRLLNCSGIKQKQKFVDTVYEVADGSNEGFLSVDVAEVRDRFGEVTDEWPGYMVVREAIKTILSKNNRLVRVGLAEIEVED